RGRQTLLGLPAHRQDGAPEIVRSQSDRRLSRCETPGNRADGQRSRSPREAPPPDVLRIDGIAAITPGDRHLPEGQYSGRLRAARGLSAPERTFRRTLGTALA